MRLLPVVRETVPEGQTDPKAPEPADDPMPGEPGMDRGEWSEKIQSP